MEERPMFRIEERGQESFADVSKEREQIVSILSGYLIEDYFPERVSFTKHGLMGPVGKLLSVVMSGRFSDAGAVVGYIVNVHENTSTKRLSPSGISRLSKAVSLLLSLRNRLSERVWLRLLREIDYAVFLMKYEDVAQRIEKKKEDTRKRKGS